MEIKKSPKADLQNKRAPCISSVFIFIPILAFVVLLFFNVRLMHLKNLFTINARFMHFDLPAHFLGQLPQFLCSCPDILLRKDSADHSHAVNPRSL